MNMQANRISGSLYMLKVKLKLLKSMKRKKNSQTWLSHLVIIKRFKTELKEETCISQTSPLIKIYKS